MTPKDFIELFRLGYEIFKKVQRMRGATPVTKSVSTGRAAKKTFPQKGVVETLARFQKDIPLQPRKEKQVRPLGVPRKAPDVLPEKSKPKRSGFLGTLVKLSMIGGGIYLLMEWNRKRLRRKAQREWTLTEYPKITDLGTTQKLEILPLIERHPSQPDLLGEAGVSYLIRTDHCNILFDVGRNTKRTEPSPLLQNMNKLGVSIDDFDTIVISHYHTDHVGGIAPLLGRSFTLSRQRVPLKDKRVFAPVPLTYPGLLPITSTDPLVIAPGVALMGVIPFEPYYPRTYLVEQSLAIRVEGKGIVIITGCGHPTLSKILARARMLFDEPVWGIVGGLHYYNESFLSRALVDIDWLASSSPLQLIAISGHDSIPAAMTAYEKAFPKIYREVRVGEKIEI